LFSKKNLTGRARSAFFLIFLTFWMKVEKDNPPDGEYSLSNGTDKEAGLRLN
jgi:hypothetical protein